MRTLITIVALLVSPSVLAQSLAFTVGRGDCSVPADYKDIQKIESAWRPDGTLELIAWDTETQQHTVIDGSGRLDVSVPGTIQLFYGTKNTPLPPDSPITFCEDAVKLKFVVRGIKRKDYAVTIETNRVVFSSEIRL